jgi:hypothetical protein
MKCGQSKYIQNSHRLSLTLRNSHRYILLVVVIII